MFNLEICCKGILCNVGLRTSLARWFGLTERAPRFMAQEQADEIYEAGMSYIAQHFEAARMAVRPEMAQQNSMFNSWFKVSPFPRQRKPLWAIKPKIHTFEHQLLETKRTCTWLAA